MDLGLFVLVFGRMKDAGRRKDVKGQRGGGVLVLVLFGAILFLGACWMQNRSCMG